MHLPIVLLLLGCAARSPGVPAPVTDDPELAAFFALTVVPPEGTPAGEVTAVMGMKVTDKVRAGLALAKRYNEAVVAGGEALPELVKLGQVYEELAASIVHAPAPASLDAEQAALFREILLDQALPLCEQARTAWHFAVRRAQEGGGEAPPVAVEGLARLEVRADRPMPAEVERIRDIVLALPLPPRPPPNAVPAGPPPPPGAPGSSPPQAGVLIGMMPGKEPIIGDMAQPPPPTEEQHRGQFEARRLQRLEQLASPETAACYGARDW